jgi:hypothetical protein
MADPSNDDIAGPVVLPPQGQPIGNDLTGSEVALETEAFASESSIDDEFPSEERQPRQYFSRHVELGPVGRGTNGTTDIPDSDFALHPPPPVVVSQLDVDPILHPEASSTDQSASGRRFAFHMPYGVVALGVLFAALVGFFVADRLASDRNLPSAPETARVEGAASPVAAPVPAPPPAIEATVPGVAVEAEPVQRSPETPAATTDTPAAPPVGPEGIGEGLSGWWAVTNRIETSAEPQPEHLNVGYRLLLAQDGSRISGAGRKWMEDGRQLPSVEQTAVVVSGVVRGETVELQLTERGASQASAGTLTYAITEAGVLQGRFSSDITRSSGSTQARRMSP